MSLLNTPNNLGMTKTNLRDLLDTLEDDTVYLVEVAVTKDNVIHKSLLWTGFTESGGYCMLFNNTYSTGEIYTTHDRYHRLQDVFYIKVIEKLKTIEKF